jgi:hypothetical protein
MSLRCIHSLFIVLPVLLACGGAGSDEAGSNDSAIQEGAPDTGSPAVGVVFGDERCSGTLIAPDVVLTAAHCLRAEQIDFFTGPGKALVEGKDDLGRPKNMTVHKGKDAAIPLDFAPSFAFGENACPNRGRDIGVVLLAEPITDIKPLPIVRDGKAPPVGTECTAIGYGIHDLKGGTTGNPTRQFGLRRSALETLSSFTDRSVDAKGKTGVADDGDSGGPLLCNGSVVGVVSCSVDSPHLVDTYGRVDTNTTWIDCTIDRLRGKLKGDACDKL